MLVRESEHSFLPPLSGDVLDIGCHGFEFSHVAIKHGASRVIAVDLGPCGQPPSGVTFTRAAIGADTRMVTYSTPAKRNAWHVGGGDAVIQQLSVADLFACFLIRNASLVKLDCERSELVILDLLPDCVEQISVEFHLHVWPEDEPLVDAVMDRMAAKYDIVQHERTIRKAGEPANYWDTLMVRKC